MYNRYNRFLRQSITYSVSLFLILFAVTALCVNSANADHRQYERFNTLVGDNPNYPEVLHWTIFAGFADSTVVVADGEEIVLFGDMYIRVDPTKEKPDIFVAVLDPGDHSKILLVRQHTPNSDDGEKWTVVWESEEAERLLRLIIRDT